tara:strand:- start:3617 stop:5347 length:1731 start_codon:yes stop_codon:yes gene_type:complete
MAASSSLLLFVAFIEVLGLGLISFLLVNIQQLNEAITSIQIASSAIKFFSIPSSNVAYIFCTMILIYSVVATLFSILAIRSISISSQLIGSRLRARVLGYFLYSEWMEVSKIQASDQISKLINDGRQVGFIISFCLHLFSRFALASLIIIGLLVYNFALSLTMVSVLLGVYGLIFFILQPSIINHGADGAHHLNKTLKVLSNIFGSLKEIMFYGVQEKFIQDYKNADSNLAWAEGSNVFLAQIPRFLIDSVILILLITGIIYVYGQEYQDFLFFGTLSIYGLAALKLLPAFQNLYYFYHEIISRKVQLNSIVEVCEKMNSTAPAVSQNIDLSFKDKIEFKNIFFQYEEKGLATLENISIAIPSGKNIAIIGPSGSGKSTFLDLLLGFLSPKHGEILVDGLPMTKDNINSIRYNFAFVPQKVYLVEDTLKNNILFGSGGAHYTDADLNNAIISSKLEEVIKKLPDGLETIVSESNQLVSGGEKQSIGIARATLKEAGVIILDEATNAMDHDLEEATMKNLLDGSKFKTVICITHKPSLLKYFDEIYVFDSGKITASGSYKKIIANNDFLEAMMKDTH